MALALSFTSCDKDDLNIPGPKAEMEMDFDMKAPPPPPGLCNVTVQKVGYSGTRVIPEDCNIAIGTIIVIKQTDWEVISVSTN